jgi:enoyl-CoA hydratase
MSFRNLLFEKDGGIARLTLNRPEKLNAYDTATRDELCIVLSAINQDEEVRVLIIDGAGRGFCAGADIDEFGTAPSPCIARRVRFARDFFAMLFALPVPTIASIHGFAVGGGLELALYCDVRIAANDAVFSLPEVHFGMIPPAGGTQMLPRAARLAVALEVVLTARKLKADEAMRHGIVTAVTDASSRARLVEEVARKMEAMPRGLACMVRRAVYRGDALGRTRQFSRSRPPSNKRMEQV